MSFEKATLPRHRRSIGQFVVLFIVSVGLLLYTFKPFMSISTSAEGWHSRATPFEGEFTPTLDDIVLAVLMNSKVEPEGFTLALIKPNLGVDAKGKVVKLAQEDFDKIVAVSERVRGLEGQFRVKQARTGFPIDRVLLPTHGEVGVYGWSKTSDELEEGGTLPTALNTLIGYAREAREGYVRGEKDEGPIKKVVDLVDA